MIAGHDEMTHLTSFKNGTVVQEMKENTKSYIMEQIEKISGHASPPNCSKESVMEAMVSLGLKSQLVNIIYGMRQGSRKENFRSNLPDDDLVVTNANELLQTKFHDKARKLNEDISSCGVKISGGMKEVCSRLMSSTATEDEKEGSGENSGNTVRPSLDNYLVQWKDLLTIVKSMASGDTNADTALDIPSCPVRSIWSKTPSLLQCSKMYKEMHPVVMHIGLDDYRDESEQFVCHRVNVASRVVELGNVLMAKKCLRLGSPPSMRSKLWRIALGWEDNVGRVGDLKCHVHSRNTNDNANAEETDFDIIEVLMFLDAQTILSDVTYFLFAESLQNALMLLSRDPWVNEHLFLNARGLHSIVNYEENNTKKEMKNGTEINNRFYPFQRLVYFMAPLCFVFEDEHDLYLAFRELFCNYWCRLHSFTNTEHAIIHLCRTFENLLISNDTPLFLHLTRFDLRPLDIAFPWLHSAFSKYLEPEQLLLLWDRIIGYDSLEMLPLLALAIFLFRSEAVLNAKTAEDMRDIFSDGSTLLVVPLLQMVLSQDLFLEQEYE